MTYTSRLRCLVFAVCLLLAGMCAAAAQAPQPPRVRALTPVPFNETPPVVLSLETGGSELRIGSNVTICFQASRAGFITLWNIATSGNVARIFPNAFSGPAGPASRGIATGNGPAQAASMHVEAARHTCVGTNGDPFMFRVDGPPGVEDLYLLWTARPELQPNVTTYPDATAFADGQRDVAAASAQDWAAAKITYDIVPPGGPVPPALPPANPNGQVGQTPPGDTPAATPAQPPSAAPQRKGHVVVLAMGANVQGLTKSNQDASVFAGTVAEMFSVDKDDVRLISNVTKADFKAGMEWVKSRTTPQDFVFIYFSGHGGQIEDPTKTSEDGYDEFLVPYDFETTKHPRIADAVFSQELDAWINALPTTNVVSVMDSCHSAGVYRGLQTNVLGARRKLYALPLETDMTLPPLPAMPVQAATRAAGGAGRIKARGILLAAAPRDKSALEGPDGSLFTIALVNAMRTARSGTLADAFQKSVDDTRTMSDGRQIPVEVGDLDVARRVVFKP